MKKKSIIVLSTLGLGDIWLLAPELVAIAKKYKIRWFCNSSQASSAVNFLGIGRNIGIAAFLWWMFLAILRINNQILVVPLVRKGSRSYILSYLWPKKTKYRQFTDASSDLAGITFSATPYITLKNRYLKVFSKLNYPKLDFIPPKKSESKDQVDYLIFNSCDKRRKFKQLSDKKLIEIIDQLKNEDKHIKLLRGPGDKYSESVLSKIDVIIFNNLQELINILSHTSTLITCEGGVAQIAKYYVNKIYVVFGPTMPTYFDDEKKVISITSKKQLPCSPCIPYGIMGCEKRPCLEQIEFAEFLFQ